VPVSVYLLPGNHDPLNAASVYHSTTFLERKPAHVHVIEDTTSIRVDEGIEIVGIPWTSKRPLQDRVALTIRKLEPIKFGTESGNQEVLDAIKKEVTVEKTD